MKDYRTKLQFEKEFKKFVHNFDETKIWFVHPSRFSESSHICFVEKGQLKKFPMYKHEYSIQLDGWRFIEFLETGTFPMQQYVMVYSDSVINPDDIGKVYEFEYEVDEKIGYKDFRMFHYTNKNVNSFFCEYRKKYSKCGIKHLPKPNTSKY